MQQLKQFCPICKSEVPYVKKYPYYLCAQCREKITDRHGNSVTYELARSPFGFKGHYKNDLTKDYLYDICYINGEELKLYTEGNNWYVQPSNYLKYAGRPEDPVHGTEESTIPYDPLARKLRKKQITIEKIIIPAFFVSMLSIVPVIAGAALLKFIQSYQPVHYLMFIGLSLISLGYSWKIFRSRIRKFSRASYFRQHSVGFILLGVAATILILTLMIFGYTF